MSDEEHTEDTDREVEETVMDEAAEDETVIEEESKGTDASDSPKEEETKDEDAQQEAEDATTPLSASEYLNPPERRWVLPTFIGMFVVYFAYYWFTYVGTL